MPNTSYARDLGQSLGYISFLGNNDNLETLEEFMKDNDFKHYQFYLVSPTTISQNRDLTLLLGPRIECESRTEFYFTPKTGETNLRTLGIFFTEDKDSPNVEARIKDIEEELSKQGIGIMRGKSTEIPNLIGIIYSRN